MKLFVNDAKYDNVGSVLSKMGQGFEFSHASGLFESDPREAVLFINCGGTAPYSASRLTAFVQSGGTIYASDLQAPLMAQMYPNVLQVRSGGSAQTLVGAVVDQGLKALIGSELSINFDLGSWQYLVTKDASVRTYIRDGERPLVISYQPSAEGTVFFTAFHNVKQTSAKEQELLRFLIFRPILSREISASLDVLVEKDLILEREFTGGLRPEVRERTFAIPSGGPWTARVSWTGQGRVAIEIVEPGGDILGRREGWVGPLELGAAAVPASSHLRIRYIEVVQKEIPFFVHLATGFVDVALGGATPSLEDCSPKRLRGSLLRPSEGVVTSFPPSEKTKMRGTLIQNKS